MDTLEETPVVEEQMEDLSAFNEQQNAEYKQRKREYLKTADGRKQFVKDQIGRFTAKLIKEEKYQIPFGVILFYSLACGLWDILSNLISIQTIVLVLICLVLINRKKILLFAKKSKLYINHLSFRVKSVFYKRK